MARRLGSTPFRELLPDSLSGDSSIRAAAAALDTVLDATTRAIPGVLLYARLAHDTGFVEPVAMLPPLARLSELSGGLASLPEPVLDLLAWQLHVEGYEAAVDLAAKRQLISGSLLLHRRRGTPWAVRTALETALRLPTVIRQWWEYEGRPYFFRVRLDVSDAGLDETGVTDAMRLIAQVARELQCQHPNIRFPAPACQHRCGRDHADHEPGAPLVSPQAGAVRTRPCGAGQHALLPERHPALDAAPACP